MWPEYSQVDGSGGREGGEHTVWLDPSEVRRSDTPPNIQSGTTTPEEDSFREKSAASGGTRTHDVLLSRRVLFQLVARLAGTN